MATKKLNVKAALLAGLLTILYIVAVFYVGVGIFLETPLDLTNYLAMAVMGLLLGGIVFIFLLFRLYYAFGIFAAGLAVASALMLITFYQGAAGWEDLVGLLSFLVILTIGLGAGLLVQLIVYLVKRSRKT
ncbi:MAG: hypothetical protein WDA02_03815 [Saccharofermentanales bacterium]